SRHRPLAPAEQLVLVVLVAEARVVLVDVQLSVEPEVVSVRPQEALDVGAGRERVVLLVLEAADVLRTDLGLGLDLVVGELAPGARLAEGVSDLEHGGVPERRAGCDSNGRWTARSRIATRVCGSAPAGRPAARRRSRAAAPRRWRWRSPQSGRTR